MFFSNNKITGKIQPIRTISALTLSAILVLAFGSLALAADTENNITDSHVAKIYKTDDQPKYKFDGAFYSKMTMNIDGGSKDSGVICLASPSADSGLDSDKGSINGQTATTLNPLGNATRAEAAAILTRYAK